MVFEDAAQGLGAKFRDRSAGTFGSFGTISFYPAKLLGCFGDGGALVTNNDEIHHLVKLLRDHGRNEEGEFVAWGTNCRLDNLQAAFLDFKLKQYSEDINRRRSLAERTISCLVNLKIYIFLLHRLMGNILMFTKIMNWRRNGEKN